MNASAAAERTARILQVVRAIPAGHTLSYAGVARRAGLPRGARLVARVLAQCDQPDVPWHRVLRADGRIAFPPDSDGHAEQARRLRAEGVTVERGRVRRPPDDPRAALDALLWHPDR